MYGAFNAFTIGKMGPSEMDSLNSGAAIQRPAGFLVEIVLSWTEKNKKTTQVNLCHIAKTSQEEEEC